MNAKERDVILDALASLHAKMDMLMESVHPPDWESRIEAGRVQSWSERAAIYKNGYEAALRELPPT